MESNGQKVWVWGYREQIDDMEGLSVRYDDGVCKE